MVVDQLAAAAGEDGRTADQACSLLLAAVGGELPDAAPVWNHTVSDRGFAAASRVDSAGWQNLSGRQRGVEGGCLRNRIEIRQITASWLGQRIRRAGKGLCR